MPSVYIESLKNQERQREEILRDTIAKSVSPSIATLTQDVRDRIQGNTPGMLCVPFLDIREGGGVLLFWDQGKHHMDVEINLDASLDFFYLNRETGEAWDIECSRNERIPEKVLQIFNFFRVIG